MSSSSIIEKDDSHYPPLALLPDSLEVPLLSSVKQRAVFDYYGPVDAPFKDAAAEYLAAHTDMTIESASRLLGSFLDITHADCVGTEAEKAACWLTMRFSRPNEDFRIPRWHQDGRMYPYDESRENVVRSKYGVTLIGPSTLILEDTSPQIVGTLKRGEEEHFYWWGEAGSQAKPVTEQERDLASERLRSWLAEQFKNEKQLCLENGQIVRFSWGRDDSPMHSEPDIVSDRVFMTVLYGSENEMRAMTKLRKVPFGEATTLEWD